MSIDNFKPYLTVDKEYGPQEIKEKGSRFISYLYPVTTKEEAETFVLKLRKKFHDATHVCFAYRLGEGEEKYLRCNDDGEPGGTAGIPIYNEIKSKGYFNALAAVVRYFGGTKLGTGGLARAYAAAARKVIETSAAVPTYIKKEIVISFPYHFTGEIMHIVSRYSLDVISREDTAAGINMKIAVPKAIIDKITQEIATKSSGKIEISDAVPPPPGKVII